MKSNLSVLNAKLRNMKLNTMLFMGIGVIVLFVVIIGLIIKIELNRIKGYSHYLYNHVYMVNKTIRDIQRNIYSIETSGLMLDFDKNMSKEQISTLVDEIDSLEKQTDLSFQFLYQNYEGSRLEIDSAFRAFNLWKSLHDVVKSIPESDKHASVYSREINGWMQLMTNYNFEKVELFFRKAQIERKVLRTQLAIVMGLIFVSSCFIIYAFIAWIKIPLQNLTKVTQQFAMGNYSTRSDYKSNNELGILSDSFNKLASSVDRQYHELREQSQILENQKNEIISKYRELEIEKEKSESADRLKTAFLLNMSHELRTPLNSIIGFSGILLKKLAGPLNEEQIKQLKMLQSSGLHLLSLINDILDISKIEAGELKPDYGAFNLNEVIKEVIQQIMPQAAEKNLSLIYSQALNEGVIESDRKRITQILINLVNNAVKFTKKGEVRISCLRETDYVLIEVSDTGIGIKAGDLDKLFTPFVQIENNLIRNFEGSGLGLSISKKLIELLRGSISVTSEFGVGSVFKITLPVSSQIAKV